MDHRCASLLVLALAGATFACGRERPAPITSGVTLTAADLRSGTGREVSARMATELCEREVKCGRLRSVDTCLAPKARKARAELTTWNCPPAAMRARVKDCIASIHEESCEAGDLTARPFICWGNVECPTTPAR
jgi:hypothetical protein